jgi:hypothetical protein
VSLRVLVACSFLVGGCRLAEPPPPVVDRAAPAAQALGRQALDLVTSGRPRPKPPSVPALSDPAKCEAEWRRLAAASSIVPSEERDEARAELLARAKGEPVVFVRTPEYLPTQSSAVRGYRKTLLSARFPWDVAGRLDARLRHTRRIARQVWLRDGYLYADRPDLGWALWERVRLEHVFDEPKLVIERGGEQLEVAKQGTRYVYESGADKGKPARLLLFDRVGVAGEDLGAPLHRDVRSLKHELGFERMRILHASETRMLAELRYGKIWVKTVLEAKGPKLSVACEMVPADTKDALAEERRRLGKEERVQSAFREAMLVQISEALPFDEPRKEWGQQDGHLRFHWEKAYLRRQEHYTFNFDRYSVFSATGEPLAPQVCIDFITETLERSSGTRYRGRGAPPGRERGAVDVNEWLGLNRRQVPRFIDYAQKHEDVFESETLSTERQTPYTFKQRFYRNLTRDADSYPPGTIVVIRGFAPWDFYSVPHYHAFFVYENDPVTGTPILLAGNAGKPRVQSWDQVMAKAPQRAIRYRIRPRIEWWASRIQQKPAPARPGPPPLYAMF